MKNRELERYLSNKKKEHKNLCRKLFKYVERNYRIIDDKIIELESGESTYAIEIIDEVELFFGVDSQTSFQIVQKWVFTRLPKNKWKEVYKNRITWYSQVVQAEARTIRATWTPEMVQDIHAFHNINVEAELAAILAAEIWGEIDRQIINDLIQINGNENFTPYRKD